MLEIHAEVERQTSVVGHIKRVVTDIRQTDIVSYIKIEQIVSHATTDTQTTVETLEGILGERAESLTLIIVLHLATHATGQISTKLRLYGEVIINAVDILQHDGHLKIVEVIGHLFLFAFLAEDILLTTFLGIEQSGLDIEWNIIERGMPTTAPTVSPVCESLPLSVGSSDLTVENAGPIRKP